MYAGGNAGMHQTFRANRRAYEKFGIIPRVLVDATVRDLSVSIDCQNFSILSTHDVPV
jgi:lactate 2-monooxygenase